VEHQPLSPIEGFFLTSKDELIFDVKGITHPNSGRIAFVRYVPSSNKTPSVRKGYRKIYSLEKRFTYLKKNYPEYLFLDPMGRGLLQYVPNNFITQIHDPRKKLHSLLKAEPSEYDALEKKAIQLVKKLFRYSKVAPEAVGISGSILVDLQTEQSDIDLIVYGKQNGSLVYHTMHSIFDRSSSANSYSKDDLYNLWLARGQEKQLSFEQFWQIEKRKLLQGTFQGTEFYIRLVLLPEQYYEPYNETTITKLGEVEIEATVASAAEAIFTPCTYELTDVQLLSKSSSISSLPSKIFSLRGRYCEVARENERIYARGLLEEVLINGRLCYYQLTLGTLPNEFFIVKKYL
jgi:hypothetical protein